MTLRGKVARVVFMVNKNVRLFFFWFLRNANTHPGLIIPVDK